MLEHMDNVANMKRAAVSNTSVLFLARTGDSLVSGGVRYHGQS